jgi:hypothetical protein
MPKDYRCADCNKKCSDPTYLRLHLTACGWRSISQQPRWQCSIPVGHLCEECLQVRVRIVMGRDFDLSQVKRHSRSGSLSLGVRTQELPT